MRLKFQMFLIFFAFFISFSDCFAQSAKVELTPLTVGDVERLKNADSKTQLDFIADFYEKNKKNGATDGQILNELLKLDVQDGKNSTFIKNISLIGNRFKDMEDFARNAVNEINMEILQNNPGRTDRLIDFDNSDTWKNIKYVSIGDKTVAEYMKVFRTNDFFSNTVETENFAAVLASCADRGKENILMSFVLFPKKETIFLRQTEGEVPVNPVADFSGSKNLTFGNLSFPNQKVFQIDGQKLFGYDKITYLPFFVKKENQKENSVVQASITLTVCQNNICQPQTVSGMVYEVDKSSVESPICPTLVREEYNVPANKNSGIVLKKAFFKQEGDHVVDLFVSAQLPFFGRGEPTLMIKNSQGLRFSDPFITIKGDDVLFKMRLLNPEQIGQKAELTLSFAYSKKYSEFQQEVFFDKPLILGVSFSFFDLFTSFFYGLKFLVLTPVLAAFLMLVFQARLAPRKSSEKTIFFFNGLAKAFYFCLGVFAVLAVVWIYVLPRGMMYWGMQFLSPIINFVFLAVFLVAGLKAQKVFDDIAVISFTEQFKRVFFLFNTEDVREKAGLVAGLGIGLLLFITPLTGIYFDLYVLLSRSPLVYGIAFVTGICLPFLAIGVLDERAAEMENNESHAAKVKKILSCPFYFQAIILLVLIGIQAGLIVLIETIALIIVSAMIILRFPQFGAKKTFFITGLIGLTFIPLVGGQYDLNNYGKADFDETVLRDSVRNNKAVYLNVTEGFCLPCQWNRLMMIYKGGPQEIRKGNLIVMGIGYNDPFLRRLLMQGGAYGLPINIMFSPSDPEGKLLPAIFTPWIAKQAVIDAFKNPAGVSSNQQTVPGQTGPTPADQGID